VNILEYSQVSIEPKSDANIYRYMSKIVGTELSNMVKPCYYPKPVIYFKDIQEQLGVTPEDIKKFKSGIEAKYKTFDIYNDKYTIMLMLAILHYAQKKKYEISKMFFLFLAIKFYSSRLHTHLKSFCNEDLWIVTLDRLSPRHLFKTKKGIPNAIRYVSDFDFNKQKNKLSQDILSDKDLISIVYGLRRKIAQSLRSFAQLYYKLYEEGKTAKSAPLEDAEVEGSQLVADKVSMTMCVFGQIDRDALKKAIIQGRVRKDLASTIITEFSVTEYKDKMRFIIILMSRLMSLKSVCVEKDRGKLIRKINSNVKIGGKYIIRDEILEMLYSLESGYQLKSIYENQLVMFFSSYITNYLRNRIC